MRRFLKNILPISAAAFVAVAVVACNGKPAPEPATATAQPLSGPPLEYVETCTGDAPPDAPLPTVIAVHGLGDQPKNFRRLFDDLPDRVRVLLPRAPAPYRGGYSWFEIRLPLSISDRSLEKGILRASDQIAAFIRYAGQSPRTAGRPLLTGFSQGGAISFATAVRHPTLLAAAVPLSGALPSGIRPPDSRRTNFPPIRAVHGTEDPLIPVAAAQKTVKRLRAEGLDVSLTVYEGLGHSVDRRARAFLYDEIHKFVSSR